MVVDFLCWLWTSQNASSGDLLSLPLGGPQAEKAINDVMRCVTGVLSSRPTSRDIKIDGFSLGLNGVELIQDCSIELTIGRRYGLLGQNGCGKTNFLCCLAEKEVRRLQGRRPNSNPHQCVSGIKGRKARIYNLQFTFVPI